MTSCSCEHDSPVTVLFGHSEGLSEVHRAIDEIIGFPTHRSLLGFANPGDPYAAMYLAADAEFCSLFDLLEQEEPDPLLAYLSELSTEHTADAAFLEVLGEVEGFWDYICNLTGRRIYTPNASLAPDSGFLLFWRKDKLYMELEFHKDHTWGFFFEDMTDPSVFDVWDAEGSFGQRLGPEEMEHVSKFAAP